MVSRNDTFAIMFGILLVCQLHVYIFKVPGIGFFAEVPIAMCALAFLSMFTLKRTDVMRAVKYSLTSVACLIPFYIIGVVHFSDPIMSYGDLRVMVILIVLSLILTRLTGPDCATRFIYVSSVTAVFVTVSMLVAGKFGIVPYGPQYSLRGVEGKFFPPTHLLYPILLCELRTRRNTFTTFLCFLAASALVFQSSYRLQYLMLVIAFLGYLVHLAYCLHGKVAPVLLGFASASLCIFTFSFVSMSKGEIIGMIRHLSWYLRDVGVSEDLVHQVITKTTQTALGQKTHTGQLGDNFYIQIAERFFDVGDFLLPRGLGQMGSIGDPVILGGNTVDSSIIFFHYHFSVFGTLTVLGISIYFIYIALRNHSVSRMLIISVATLGMAMFIYFRALAFTVVYVSVGLSFFVAMLYHCRVRPKDPVHRSSASSSRRR